MARGQRDQGTPKSPELPWWQPREGDSGPSPLVSLRLLGLDNRTADIVVSAAVVLALVVSRLLVLPASIWEQDEAYFAASVVDFDPLRNHPHPPWFPLWVLLGKLAHLVVGDPAAALCWASLAFSVWLVFPLTALWSTLLRRELALAAALLFSLLPGVWILSARAFTEIAATALLALTFACWFGPVDRRRLLTGSLAAGACLLVRAHFGAALLPLAVVRLGRVRDWPGRLRVIGPMAGLVAVGYGAVVLVAGGPSQLVDAVGAHAALHFGQLDGFSSTFARSGLARALVSPWLAGAWIALALWGAVAVTRNRRLRQTSAPLLGCVVAPLAGLVVLLSNPDHLRYAVPLLAFSSGLVVAGAASFVRRWALVAAAAAVVAGCWQVLPEASGYRRQPSPAVAAVEHAFARARATGSVVVVDRTLTAFVELERMLRPFRGTVVYDHQLERGETGPPPEWATIFVFDRGHGMLLTTAASTRRFACDRPLLRRLSQGRFLDVTVAEGADLRSR